MRTRVSWRCGKPSHQFNQFFGEVRTTTYRAPHLYPWSRHDCIFYCSYDTSHLCTMDMVVLLVVCCLDGGVP